MWRLVLIVVALSSCTSCGQPAASVPADRFSSVTQLALDAQKSPFADQAEGGETTTSIAQVPTALRQIIYQASLVLRVRSFAETDQAIQSLITASGGYLAQFREDRSYGAQRGGQWTIRVPATGFSSFLDELGKLGVAERREVKSQDVTEEYIDLQARLKNKQALEKRLLELVASRGDEIKDVLALETELSRVREEIEKLEGRLRYLTDRVALTTIEITAYERLDYEPPEATFAQRVQNTFWLSLDRLRHFGEFLAIAITALAPWTAVALLGLMPLAVVVRRRQHGRGTKDTDKTPPTAAAN